MSYVNENELDEVELLKRGSKKHIIRTQKGQ